VTHGNNARCNGRLEEDRSVTTPGEDSFHFVEKKENIAGNGSGGVGGGVATEGGKE